MRRFAVLVGSIFLLAACGGDGESADSTTSSVPATTTTTSPAPPTTTTIPATTTTLVSAADLATAEAFIDAFYSFDQAALEATLTSAQDAIPFVTFYQGWAEGANYEIVNRMPCDGLRSIIKCSVTVSDDLIRALNLGFNVTDTFSVVFSTGEVVGVNLHFDEPEVSEMGFDWVIENRPELFDGGVCSGFFDGGATPGECAQAFVEGFEDFAASDDFPDLAGVIEEYIAAYNSGDIERVMALFSEDSVVTGHPSAARSEGLAAIRAVQLEDIADAATENAYTISNVDVTGDTVTWDHVWISSDGNQFCKEGHNAVIKGGKILTWAWPGGGFDCP